MFAFSKGFKISISVTATIDDGGQSILKIYVHEIKRDGGNQIDYDYRDVASPTLHRVSRYKL